MYTILGLLSIYDVGLITLDFVVSRFLSLVLEIQIKRDSEVVFRMKTDEVCCRCVCRS